MNTYVAYLVSEACHRQGCACGFCKNKGKIGDWRKKKQTEPEEKEPVKESSDVKLSRGVNLGGPAARKYAGMTSAQALKPEWKVGAYSDAVAEVTGQTDRKKGFQNRDFGSTTDGKKFGRHAESRARGIVAALLDRTGADVRRFQS